MRKGGFDGLIDYLLERVALCGERGAGSKDFIAFVKRHYEVSGSAFEDEDDVPPAPTVDRRFLEVVWKWLSQHPDIYLGDFGKKKRLALDEFERLEDGICTSTTDEAARTEVGTSSATASRSGRATQSKKTESAPRIYTTEERSWQAITGHGIDLKRVPKMEFELLCIISSRGDSGILQPELIRISGQDKRSVPARTDRLHEKGYIIKETVSVQRQRTSHCILRRYQEEKDDPVQQSNGQISLARHGVFVEGKFLSYRFLDYLVNKLNGNANKIVVHSDVRRDLELQPVSWEVRILNKALTRLEALGVVRRLRARPKDAPEQVWLRCIKLERQPTDEDRHNFRHLSTRDGMDRQRDINSKDRQNSTGNINDDEDMDASGDEEDLDLDLDLADDGVSLVKIDDIEESARIPPQWDPDMPLNNFVFEVLEAAGLGGLSSMDLRARTFGQFWRRPLDNIVVRLTDIWQYSQPPHLKHLCIVKDTALLQDIKNIHFHYRTYLQFKAAVEAGEASWEAVQRDQDGPGKKKAKKNKLPWGNKLELDKWAFPPIPLGNFVGHNHDASLAECLHIATRKKVQRKKSKYDRLAEEDQPAWEEGADPPTPRVGASQSFGWARLRQQMRGKDEQAWRKYVAEIRRGEKEAKELRMQAEKIALAEALEKLKKEGKAALVEAALQAEGNGAGKTATFTPQPKKRGRPSKKQKVDVDVNELQQFDINSQADIPITGKRAILLAQTIVTEERIRELMVDIREMRRPGAYINPPGSGRLLNWRGRPRKSTILVIKSQKLKGLDLDVTRLLEQRFEIPEDESEADDVQELSTQPEQSPQRPRRNTELGQREQKDSDLDLVQTLIEAELTQEEQTPFVPQTPPTNEEVQAAQESSINPAPNQAITAQNQTAYISPYQQLGTLRGPPQLYKSPYASIGSVSESTQINQRDVLVLPPANHAAQTNTPKRQVNQYNHDIHHDASPTIHSALRKTSLSTPILVSPSVNSSALGITEGSVLNVPSPQTITPILPKRRGRPKKRQQAPSVERTPSRSLPPSEASITPSIATPSIADATSAVKRKRGRPRKNPLPEQLETSNVPTPNVSGLLEESELSTSNSQDVLKQGKRTADDAALPALSTPSKKPRVESHASDMAVAIESPATMDVDSIAPLPQLQDTIIIPDQAEIQDEDRHEVKKPVSKGPSLGHNQEMMRIESDEPAVTPAPFLESTQPIEEDNDRPNGRIHDITSADIDSTRLPAVHSNTLRQNSGLDTELISNFQSNTTVSIEIHQDLEILPDIRSKEVEETNLSKTDLPQQEDIINIESTTREGPNVMSASRPTDSNSRDVSTPAEWEEEVEETGGPDDPEFKEAPVTNKRPKKQRPTSTRLTGGAVSHRRTKIIMDIVERCNGVYPGQMEISKPFFAIWDKQSKPGERRPDRNTVKSTLKNLIEFGKLKRLAFTHTQGDGKIATKYILILPHISAFSAEVQKVRNGMIAAKGMQYYYPPGVRDLVGDGSRTERSGHTLGYQKDPEAIVEVIENKPTFMIRLEQRIAEIARRREEQVKIRSAAAAAAAAAAATTATTSTKRTYTPRKRLAGLRAPIGYDDAKDKRLQPFVKNFYLDGDTTALDRDVSGRPILARSGDITWLQQWRLLHPEVQLSELPGARLEKISAAISENGSEDEWSLEDEKLAHSLQALSHCIALKKSQTQYYPNIGVFATNFIVSDHPLVEQKVGAYIPQLFPKPLHTIAQHEEWPDAPSDPDHLGLRFVNRFLLSDGAIVKGQEVSQSSNREPDHNIQTPEIIEWDDEGGRAFNLDHPPPDPHEDPELVELLLLEAETSARSAQINHRGGRSRQPISPRKRVRINQTVQYMANEWEKTQTNDPSWIPGMDLPRNQALHAEEPTHRGSWSRMPTENSVPKTRKVHVSNPNCVIDGSATRKLLYAVAVVKSLAGGVERSISHQLIDAIFHDHPNFDTVAFRNRVTWLRRNFADRIENLTQEFQDSFITAYERAEVPSIDYEHLDKYDWSGVVQWAMKNVTIPFDDNFTLPASRKSLEKNYCIRVKEGPHGRPTDELHRPSNMAARRAYLITTYSFTAAMHPEKLPNTEEIPTEEYYYPGITKAKTWIRANSTTPDVRYTPEAAQAAHRRLLQLNHLLDKALSSLVSERILQQTTKGPGRNYMISDFLVAGLTGRIEAKQFHDAMAFKRDLDRAFKPLLNNPSANIQGVSIPQDASDGAFMALTNLAAYGRVQVIADLPPTDDTIGKPFPRITRWGFTEGNYRTAQMKRERLVWAVKILPTSRYVFGNPLSKPYENDPLNPLAYTPIALPPPPMPRPDDPSCPLPLWVDITSGFLPEWWQRLVAAIIQLLIGRPRLSPRDISRLLKHLVGVWEIRLVLKWLHFVGAVDKPSGDVWRLAEWWWVALGDGNWGAMIAASQT